MKRAPTEAEIMARIDEMDQQLAAGWRAVRDALIAGRSSASARAEVAKIEADIAAAHAELAALLAHAAAEKATKVEAAGNTIASATVAEIETKLAGLQPPQHPNPVEF